MSIDYTKRPKSSSAAPDGPVSLTKRGQSVSLRKDTGGQPYRFNLNWNPRPAGAPAPAQGGGGFMKKLRGAANVAPSGGQIDLDLACLFELKDGRKGVVQALGNTFGSLTSPPYVQLDQDDRSGQAVGGENLLISSQHQSEIARLVVFAFIYEGVANWSQADAVATIHQPGGEPITIALDEHRDGVVMCAIAHLDNGTGAMELSREVIYFAQGHRELDAHYGWGMNWTAGSK